MNFTLLLDVDILEAFTMIYDDIMENIFYFSHGLILATIPIVFKDFYVHVLVSLVTIEIDCY